MPKLDRRRENPDPANLVGSRLREVRGLRAHSQATLAELVQEELRRYYPEMSFTLDQSDISRLENGRRPVWDYEVRAFAVVLGVSADYLLGLSTAM